MRLGFALLVACSRPAPYDPALLGAPLREVGSRAGPHTFTIELPQALVVGSAAGPEEARWQAPGEGAPVVTVRFNGGANPRAIARGCQDVSDGKLCCEVVADAAFTAWGDRVCKTLHPAT